MSSYVSASLRRRVTVRADHLCEYCLIHEDDTFFGCEVDHVISQKHGGTTESANLAYACAFCNRYKGSDIGSIDRTTDEFVRFYNPRTDTWGQHFVVEDVKIIALTAIGRVTVAILKLNMSGRLLERQTLRALGKYPSEAALARMAL